MAILGIRGDKLRAAEIKQTLMALGGKDSGNWSCTEEDNIYYINTHTGLIDAHSLIVFDDNDIKELKKFYKVTIDDFYKQFPYRKGDKVYVKTQKQVGIVKKMMWGSYEDEVLYEVGFLDIFVADFTAEVDELEPYANQDVCLKIDPKPLKTVLIYSLKEFNVEIEGDEIRIIERNH